MTRSKAFALSAALIAAAASMVGCSSGGKDEQPRAYIHDHPYLFSFAGPGLADGEFDCVGGMTVGGDGMLYVCDMARKKIQVFDSSGGFIRTYQIDLETSTDMPGPSDVAVGPDGSVYAVMPEGDAIVRISGNGSSTSWGSSGSGVGEFDRPTGICVDGSACVYVADSGNHRIQKFSASGEFIAAFGGGVLGDGELLLPTDVAVDGDSAIYVTDSGNFCVQKFSSSFAYLGQWGSEGDGDSEFSDDLFSISIYFTGDIIVADCINHAIKIFDPRGAFLWKAVDEEEGNEMISVASDSSGNIYVGDMTDCCIHKLGES